MTIENWRHIVTLLRDVPGDFVLVGDNQAGGTLAEFAVEIPPTQRSGSYWGTPPPKKVVMFAVAPAMRWDYPNLKILSGNTERSIEVYRHTSLSLLAVFERMDLAMENFWGHLNPKGMLLCPEYLKTEAIPGIAQAQQYGDFWGVTK